MTIHRWAAKRDSSEPLIVDALEAAGFDVERMSKPADLLVRRPWYPRGVNLVLECKTPQGKTQRLPVDKRQVDQARFLGRGGAVTVGTPEAALEALHAFEVYQGGPYGSP